MGEIPKGFSFSENKYVAVEEVRSLLGLSAEELESFLRVLDRAKYFKVKFERDGLTMTFHNFSTFQKRVVMEVREELSHCEKIMKYILWEGEDELEKSIERFAEALKELLSSDWKPYKAKRPKTLKITKRDIEEAMREGKGLHSGEGEGASSEV
ncbi:MAG: hypothetical protein ACE5Z5_13195 [Candidatus Bathyarchaeia archaeon]